MTFILFLITLPLDPDAADIDARIVHGLQLARSAVEGSPHAAESLRELANTLPERATVAIEQFIAGESRPLRVTVRYDWLRFELHRALDELPDGSRLQRLIAYATALRYFPTDDYLAPSDDTDYAAAAADILSRREFHPESGRNWFSEMLSRLFQNLWELLRDMIPTPDPVDLQSPVELTGVGEVIMYSLIGIGGILLIYVMVKLFRHYRNQDKETAPKEPHPLLEQGETTEPDEHWRLAQTEAQAGNHRRAIRHVLLSVILHLDRLDYVHYDRHLTNREYGERIREAESLPLRQTAHAAWHPLAALFDRVWYGRQAATDADFHAAVDCRRRIIQDVSPASEVPS